MPMKAEVEQQIEEELGKMISDLEEEYEDVFLDPEIIVNTFRRDPKVISAEYKDGEFHIDTIFGSAVIGLKLGGRENA